MEQGMEQEEYDPSLADFLDLQRTSQVTTSTDHDQPAKASPDPKRRQPTPTKGKTNSAPEDPAKSADFDPFLGESYSPTIEPVKSDSQAISGPTKGYSSVDSRAQGSNQSSASHPPSGSAKAVPTKSTRRADQPGRPEPAFSPTSTQATKKTDHQGSSKKPANTASPSQETRETEPEWAEFLDWVSG